MTSPLPHNPFTLSSQESGSAYEPVSEDLKWRNLTYFLGRALGDSFIARTDLTQDSFRLLFSDDTHPYERMNQGGCGDRN